MKVVVIAWPGEGEYDIFLGCRQMGIDIEMFFVNIGNIKGYLNEIWDSGGVPPDLKYTLIDVKDVGNVINRNPADLYLLKYPQRTWSRPSDESKVVCWFSEQGLTLPYAESCTAPYSNMGINNKAELVGFKVKYSNKNVMYMPYGCYLTPDSPVKAKTYDLIADARYPSGRDRESNIRLQSADVMVKPVLDYNIALYGVGWEYIPNVGDRHKGVFNHWEYPRIYSNAKIYLGVTWNWRHAGFGIKLARSLSTGIPVIWHKTPGMELEGWEKGNQLDWSSSPEETKKLVDYYLSHDQERVEMGLRGQKWALKHWHWGNILKGIEAQLG